MSIKDAWHRLTDDVTEKYHQVNDTVRCSLGVNNHLSNDFLGSNLTSTDHLPTIKLYDKGGFVAIEKPGNYSVNVMVHGVSRHFSLHVPLGYDKSTPIPLLVALHGFGQSGTELEKLSGLDKDADLRKAAIIYPDARAWLGIKELAAWDTGNGLVPIGSHGHDIEFLRTTIDFAHTHLKINRNRVYLLGVSNGGMEAYKAAAELSDTVAAVVDISGAMSGRELQPAFPVSVMSIVGTKDDIVPPAGRTKEEELNIISKRFFRIATDGLSQKCKRILDSDETHNLSTYIVATMNFAPIFKPVAYATNFWLKADHIQVKPVQTRDTGVAIDLYRDEKTGTAVEQVALNGVDHAAQHGIPSKFKLNDAAWDFLAAHPKHRRSLSSHLADYEYSERLPLKH